MGKKQDRDEIIIISERKEKLPVISDDKPDIIRINDEDISWYVSGRFLKS